MPVVKPLYIGEIRLRDASIFLTHRGSRQACTVELNGWLFDWTRCTGKHIVQLPPLDDWTRSVDDIFCWYYTFTELELTVSVRVENVEFP